MKILFLDVDGPMLSCRAWIGSEGGGCFRRWDPIAVRMVNHILEEVPDLQIVVSSTWGHHLGKEKFTEHMVLNGMDPTRLHEDWQTYYGHSRSDEIHEWLKEHSGVEIWFALDDMEVRDNPVPRVKFDDGISMEIFNDARALFGIKPFIVL